MSTHKSIVGALIIFLVSVAYTTVPPTTPAAHTNAPGESTCAKSGCHFGMINSGSGAILLTSMDSIFQSDSTYLFQLQVADTNQAKFGFQLTVLDSLNNRIGELGITTPNNSLKVNSGSRQYLSHRDATSNDTWQLTWKAPKAIDYQGIVTIYFCGNASNDNGDENGDLIYCSTINSKHENYTVVSSISNRSVLENISVYPNPALNLIRLNTKEIYATQLYDSEGNLLMKSELGGGREIDISQLPKGVFFVQLFSKSKSVIKKLVKL